MSTASGSISATPGWPSLPARRPAPGPDGASRSAPGGIRCRGRKRSAASKPIDQPVEVGGAGQRSMRIHRGDQPAVAHPGVFHAQGARSRLQASPPQIDHLANEHGVAAAWQLAAERHHITSHAAGIGEHRHAVNFSRRLNPASVCGSPASANGLTNLRTSARCSLRRILRAKTPPSCRSSWLTAAASTLTATSFGSTATWVAQLRVMRLRRVAPRVPST